MENPEKLAIKGTQDEENTTQYVPWTPLHASKHKQSIKKKPMSPPTNNWG